MGVYGRLVGVLPADLRRAHGQEMRQTFADLCIAAHRERGHRGLIAVQVRCFADLSVGAVQEWARVFTRAARARARLPHRVAAMATVGLATLAIAVSVLRYPANLTLASYALLYALLAVTLTVLGCAFVAGRDIRPLTVICGLASTPAWVAGYFGAETLAIISIFLIAALLTAAGMRETRPLRAVRAGALAGTLAGIVLLGINTVDGLADMGALLHNAAYLAEFARTGQTSVAAYIMGERIAGGAYAVGFGALAGAVLGALTGLTRTLTRAIQRPAMPGPQPDPPSGA
jgi:hypothetical protein